MNVEDSDVHWPGFFYSDLADHKVLTTSDIPMQAQQTNFPTLRLLLARGSEKATGRAFPNELIDLIFSFGEFGVSAAGAEGLRRHFMSERSHRSGDEAGVSAPFTPSKIGKLMTFEGMGRLVLAL